MLLLKPEVASFVKLLEMCISYNTASLSKPRISTCSHMIIDLLSALPNVAHCQLKNGGFRTNFCIFFKNCLLPLRICHYFKNYRYCFTANRLGKQRTKFEEKSLHIPENDRFKLGLWEKITNL